MRSCFRRKPLVWIFSAVSQLKIPPVGRIITIVWSPHNPATIRPREWGVMAIVWQRGWHTGWTTAPGPSAPTTPGLQAYSYPTSSPPGTTSLTIGALGASKTLLVHCVNSLFPRNWWWAPVLKWCNWCRHWPGRAKKDIGGEGSGQPHPLTSSTPDD